MWYLHFFLFPVGSGVEEVTIVVLIVILHDFPKLSLSFQGSHFARQCRRRLTYDCRIQISKVQVKGIAVKYSALKSKLSPFSKSLYTGAESRDGVKCKCILNTFKKYLHLSNEKYLHLKHFSNTSQILLKYFCIAKVDQNWFKILWVQFS